jgi:hypothetical protein
VVIYPSRVSYFLKNRGVICKKEVVLFYFSKLIYPLGIPFSALFSNFLMGIINKPI